MGFPGGSDGKESACNTGDPGSVSGLGSSPGGGPGNPLQYCCLENPHGPRSLAGCSPWGPHMGDTTEVTQQARGVGGALLWPGEQAVKSRVCDRCC